MLLKNLAGPRLYTVEPDDSIDRAMALMKEHGIRHLPVVRHDGVSVGVLSDRDILEGIGWLPRHDRTASRLGGATVGPQCVCEIMSIPPIALGSNENVERAARLMLEKKFNAVPVMVNNRIVGIVTETDMLRCCLTDGRGPRGLWRFQRVGEHMHANVLTLRSQALLREAGSLMRAKRIRHVPIVDDGKLVGMVSDHDVRREIGRGRIGQALERRRRPATERALGSIMTRPVATIAASATLADAAGRMVAGKFGALPVVDGTALVGIITETDLLYALVAALEA